MSAYRMQEVTGAAVTSIPPVPIRDPEAILSIEQPPESEPRDRLDSIVGKSVRITEAVQRARLLANVATSVLLQGETGVGKDVFARAIHDCSNQHKGPFVALNCGGLPRDLLSSELFGYADGAFTGARRSGMVGKIEAANGGTLFLDEIAEMPLDLQPYLLRVLENGQVCPLGSNRARTVHFRLIAASNRDLRAEVNAGRFRMDLFYRISVTSLSIPPLRERTEDLPALVEHFSEEACRRHSVPTKRFAPEVLAAFARYSWPGNVRELRNVVEAMVLMAEGDVVGMQVMPNDMRSHSEARPDNKLTEALHLGVEALECDAIGAAIRQHQGNLTQAARALRIARSTLYLKMKKYSLELVRDEVRYSAR
jgi:sigma-54 dependent transcriptional regulator, acetoin dehydrogenase operon transcriptional activator AcoR